MVTMGNLHLRNVSSTMLRGSLNLLTSIGGCRVSSGKRSKPKKRRTASKRRTLERPALETMRYQVSLFFSGWYWRNWLHKSLGNKIALRLPQKGPVPSRFVHTVACALCEDAFTNQTKDSGTIFGFDLGFLKFLKKEETYMHPTSKELYNSFGCIVEFSTCLQP